MFFYHLYDFMESLLIPSNAYLKATQEYFSRFPNLSKNEFARMIVGSCETFNRILKHREKPKFNIRWTKIKNTTVSIEEETVFKKPFCNLQHFRKEQFDKNEPNVLIIAPLAGHHATLLRDTVNAMLPKHNVYITDWISARDVPLDDGEFGLDTYIDYLIEFLGVIGPGTHVMGVCQPAVQIIALGAILDARNDPLTPVTLIPMGGPIDPRANPTSVNRFAETYPLEWFRSLLSIVPEEFPGAGRLVYPGFVQILAFLSMHPDTHIGAFIKYIQDTVHDDKDSMNKHSTFYDEYLSVIDLDSKYYLETIDHIFQKHEFPQGLLKYKNKIVDPSKIKTCALLTIEGEKDDIAGPGQTYAAHHMCSSIPVDKKEHYLQKGVGHYGIFSGSKWRTFIAPRIADFIRKHDLERKSQSK